MMRHKSGAVSVVECSMESRIDPDPFPETLVTIEGERGSASVGPGLAAHVTSDGQSQRSRFRIAIAELDLAALAYGSGERAAEPRRRSCAPGGGKDPESTGDDNLKTYALVEAAYEAARAGPRRRSRHQLNLRLV